MIEQHPTGMTRFGTVVGTDGAPITLYGRTDGQPADADNAPWIMNTLCDGFLAPPSSSDDFDVTRDRLARALAIGEQAEAVYEVRGPERDRFRRMAHTALLSLRHLDDPDALRWIFGGDEADDETDSAP